MTTAILCLIAVTSAAPKQEGPVIRRIVSVFVSVPADAPQFRRMYGRDPSKGQLDDIAKSRRRITDRLPNARMLTSERDLSGRLAADPAGVVVLLGHNEGGSFVFPDGRTLQLAELAATARRHNKRLVVVSCEADCYLGGTAAGTRGRLRVPEAIDITQRFVSTYSEGRVFVALPKPSAAERLAIMFRTGMDYEEYEIARLLSQAETSTTVLYTVKKIGVVGAGGAGLYQVVVKR